MSNKHNLRSRIVLQLIIWCLFMVICLLVAFLFQNPTLREHRDIWNNQNINSYIITLERVGYGVFGSREIENEPVTLTVVDNQLVEATPMCYDCDLEDYQQFTVDGLFEFASGCSCNIRDYNATYGYLERLGAMFIEGGWVQVIDFQPLTSE